MFLKYTHPAAMKYETNKSYTLEELQEELSDEMIKVLFAPVDFCWEDIEDTEEIKVVDFDLEED